MLVVFHKTNSASALQRGDSPGPCASYGECAANAGRALTTHPRGWPSRAHDTKSDSRAITHLWKRFRAAVLVPARSQKGKSATDASDNPKRSRGDHMRRRLRVRRHLCVNRQNRFTRVQRCWLGSTPCKLASEQRCLPELDLMFRKARLLTPQRSSSGSSLCTCGIVLSLVTHSWWLGMPGHGAPWPRCTTSF